MNSEKPSQPESTKETILDRINREGISMHSRTYFMLRLIGLAVLTLLILIISIFICTFIFFILRLNGHDALPAFGPSGWVLFLRFFPWHLLILDVLFVILLRYLLRTFPIAYRTPWVYAVLALIVVSISTGLVIDRGTRVNDDLLRRSDQGGVPFPIRGVYEGARRPLPPGVGAFRGIITNVASSSIQISDPDRSGGPLLVQLPQRQRYDLPPFTVGQTVFIFGKETDGVISAFDIHPIDEQALPPGMRQ